MVAVAAELQRLPPSVTRLNHLKRLSITLTDDEQLKLVSQLHTLRELKVGFNWTPDSFLDDFQPPRSLRSISLSGQVPRKSIVNFQQKYPRIEIQVVMVDAQNELSVQVHKRISDSLIAWQ